MPDNGFGWHAADRPPTSDEFVAAQGRYYRHTIECFGPDRCMFESNFPVDRMSISYRVLWNGLKKIAAPVLRGRAGRDVRGHGDARSTGCRERCRRRRRRVPDRPARCSRRGCREDPDRRGAAARSRPRPHDAPRRPPGVAGPNFFRARHGAGPASGPSLVATRGAGQAAVAVRPRAAAPVGRRRSTRWCAIRGTLDDYERWAGELGCTGWGWPEMLAAFLARRGRRRLRRRRAARRRRPIPLRAARRRRAAAARPRVARGDDRPRLPDVRRLPRARRHRRRAASRSRCATAGGSRRTTRTSSRLADAPNLDVRGDVLVDRVLPRRHGARSACGPSTATRSPRREVIVERRRDPLARDPAAVGRRRDDGLPVGANLKDHAATPGFEIALRPEGRMASRGRAGVQLDAALRVGPRRRRRRTTCR